MIHLPGCTRHESTAYRRFTVETCTWFGGFVGRNLLPANIPSDGSAAGHKVLPWRLVLSLECYHFLDELASLPYVEAVYLFGSRARGDHRERSDIDLAVLCPEADEQDWLDVLAIVEQADTLLTIDCVRLDAEAENSPLRAAIEREKKVLYERGS